MYLSLISLGLAALAAASPTPDTTSDQAGVQKQKIKWGKCKRDLQTGKIPLDCGTVTVPLDYTEPYSDKTLDIELVRAKHTKKPFRGSIVMNFGGPGGSGAYEMGLLADSIVARTGGQHDILAFDQRGTGDTLLFSCFKNKADYNKYLPYIGEAGNASDVSLGRLWASTALIADECQSNAKEVGQLIGSAFTARDVMQIVDTLDEDGKLRYWGFSYGSALGQTVASMFPERMDKVILDGNVNPYQWWNYHDVEMYADTDKTFRGFAAACAAKPQNCALARPNSTAESIEATVYEIFEHYKYHPAPYKGLVVDYSYIRGNLLGGLYAPGSYPLYAYVLEGFRTGNLSVIDEIPPPGKGNTGDRRWGIVCSDKTTRGKADALRASNEVMDLSKVAGDVAVQFIMQCGNWQIDAKERYTGDFNVKTANPLLVIGNTHDPVTPLRSAFNMSSTFQDSVVLTQNGFGHASSAQASKCTDRHLQAYLFEGKLPEKGTVCEVDEELFAEPFPAPEQ